MFIGIFGTIFSNSQYILVSLACLLIYALCRYKATWKFGKIVGLLDEYSFSIYLGHTTVMEIMSCLQSVYGFSTMKLAMLDVIGCVIFIPLLHNLIEKPVGKGLKKLLKV